MTAAPAPRKRAVIVAGATCSGKSALALAIARRAEGTVINADSMQVYAELCVLTARPTPGEEAEAPHALYGVRPAAQPGSVAWWRDSALIEMERAHASGRIPVLCGGTGLYLAALTQGLAPIPDPGPAARAEARDQLQALGPEGLHARLARADPATAARLRPTDRQRIARAWEVLRGTGHGLIHWQSLAPSPPDWRFRAVVLDPPRDDLRQAIAARCDAMVEEGALAEVQALLAQNLPPSLPAMRAHGVAEFAAFLRAEISLAEAVRRTSLVTGQYTKRQATWLRHRMPTAEADTRKFDARYGKTPQVSESIAADAIQFILSAA